MREGGEKRCEWRRTGSADDETGTCGSACALRVFITGTGATCACTGQGGEGAKVAVESLRGGHGALFLKRRVVANIRE